METSAKEYKKVETAFNLLAEDIVRQIENGHIPEQTIGIKVSDDFKFETATAKRKLCC